mmetsp:Transcript_4505/g.6809  ORF Transcript_4505/g.6809 Transcript_4505/m.6809 type:complete len:241 (+) Transcript_4505:70-792(+)
MTDRTKMSGGGGSDIVDDDSKSLQNNERDADTEKGDIIGASQSQPDVSNTTDAITTSASKFWTQNKRIAAASISLAALVLATAAVSGTAASNKTSLGKLGVGEEPPISASAREEPGSETMALPCKNWCHSLQHASTPWSIKCNWKNCKGCDSCKEEVKPCAYDGHQCEDDTECCGSCVNSKCVSGDTGSRSKTEGIRSLNIGLGAKIPAEGTPSSSSCARLNLFLIFNSISLSLIVWAWM